MSDALASSEARFEIPLRNKKCFLHFLRNIKQFSFRSFRGRNWAGDATELKSTFGYVVRIGGLAVSWCPQKQKVDALSSTGYEYSGLCSVTKEAIWVRRFDSGVGIVAKLLQMPLIGQADNQGEIDDQLWTIILWSSVSVQ